MDLAEGARWAHPERRPALQGPLEGPPGAAEQQGPARRHRRLHRVPGRPAPGLVPFIGQVDDALLAAVVLRHFVHSAGPEVSSHWRGDLPASTASAARSACRSGSRALSPGEATAPSPRLQQEERLVLGDRTALHPQIQQVGQRFTDGRTRRASPRCSITWSPSRAGGSPRGSPVRRGPRSAPRARPAARRTGRARSSLRVVTSARVSWFSRSRSGPASRT